MGDYNPNAPFILGNEWVPIRQANYVPDDIFERGYITRIEHAVTPVSGSIAVAEVPPQILTNIVEFVSVYSAVNALNSGPTRRVIIPVEAITITGSNITSTNGSFTALTNPNDFEYVGWNASATVLDSLGISFNVGGFSNELNGKRILGVRLIYVASGEAGALAAMEVGVVRHANSNENHYYQKGLEGAIDLTLETEYSYIDFREYNVMWTTGTSGLTGSAIYPWRYTELALLDSSASVATRLVVVVDGNMSSAFTTLTRLSYVALEVTYCEETRILYGGRRSLAQGFPVNAPQQGDNLVQLRDTNFALATTSLPPDDYLVTAIHKKVSSFVTAKSPPTYSALREFHELATLPTVALQQPVAVDGVLTEVETSVVPAIGLWTAASVVTGAHDYSTQVAAPAYGSIFAEQEVTGRSSIVGTAPYTQVRFYARRVPTTTIPLSVFHTLSAQTVTISVAEFDALPEIIDGWREVTLRWPTPISLGPTTVAIFRWLATGEVAGAQWQVIGARAFNNGPNNQSLMTYDPPAGATVNSVWKQPNTAGSTSDTFTDMTILLSQDPPTISGFEVSQGTLAVTGVAVECGVPTGCIPTGVGYNQLSWGPQPAGCDTFSNRTLVDEWGAMETGQDYTLSGGTVPGNYDVANDVGTHTLDTNSERRSIIATPTADNYVTERFSVPVVAAGAGIITRLSPRFIDSNNYYHAELAFNTDNTVTLRIGKFVAAVSTTLTVSVNVGMYNANSWYGLTTRMVGTRLEARAWAGGNPADEPTTWQIIVDDTSLSTGSNVAWMSQLRSGNTNGTVVVSFDDLYTITAALTGGRLQVDRMDVEDLVWQTIVDTANFCVTGVQDLEARVGVQSWYRARLLNAGNFAGPWVSGTGTIPVPGTVGAGDGNSTLIFTSNAAPLATLAYVMAWDGKPIESFVFPEADTQVLQRMYNRDFQVAFRPLERGGEAFDRTILVQAAAIPVESLANFVNLRSLAWADLPYVCVRDELGNRWFANVLVPGGNVQRNRRLYLAQIRVTEVTDTPAPLT